MRPRFWLLICAALWVLIPPAAEAASSRRPVITRLDTQFLDNNVNINVHWDSPNPVVLIKLLVGPEQKEIKVDEYDNKRNPRGYTGEATVVLNVQPRPGLDFVNYVIYVEDDLRQKSEQRSGRAKVPTTVMAQPVPGMPSVQVGVQVGVQPGMSPGMPGYGPQQYGDPSQQGMQPGYGPQSGQPMGMPMGPATGYPPSGQPGMDPSAQYGQPMGTPIPMGPSSGYPTGGQPGMDPGYQSTQPGQPMGTPIPMGPSSGYPTGGQPGMDPGYPGGQPGQTMGTPMGSSGGYQTGMQQGYPGAQYGQTMGATTGYQSGTPPGYPSTQYGQSPGPQAGFQIGTSSGGAMGGQSSGPTGMISLVPSQEGTAGTILGALTQIDVPPYFSDLTVNLFQGSNNFTVSGKVIDDKGLREINFRIFDAAGNKVQEQMITNQGRVWQGTTNPFTLPAGKYRVIAQAVDLGGNSSKERTADFEITAQGQLTQTPSSAPAMTPEQAQAFSAPSPSPGP